MAAILPCVLERLMSQGPAIRPPLDPGRLLSAPDNARTVPYAPETTPFVMLSGAVGAVVAAEEPVPREQLSVMLKQRP